MKTLGDFQFGVSISVSVKSHCGPLIQAEIAKFGVFKADHGNTNTEMEMNFTSRG